MIHDYNCSANKIGNDLEDKCNCGVNKNIDKEMRHIEITSHQPFAMAQLKLWNLFKAIKENMQSPESLKISPSGDLFRVILENQERIFILELKPFSSYIKLPEPDKNVIVPEFDKIYPNA